MTTRKHARWQFSLRTMLVAVTLAAILLLGWRWYTWPSRTIRELDHQVKNGLNEFDIKFVPDYRMPIKDIAHQLKQYHTVAQPRTMSDIIAARRIYLPDGIVICWVEIDSNFNHVLLESITIERGKITYQWGQTFWDYQATHGPDQPPPPLPGYGL